MAADSAATGSIVWLIITTASEHVYALCAAAVCALLLYADLRRRLTVRRTGAPAKKLPTMWPVLGMLPDVVRAMKSATLVQDIRNSAESNDWKTYAIWTPMMAELAICSPENMKHVFKTQFHRYEIPLQRRRCFEEALGSGIFNSDQQRWRELRSSASHLFSAAQLKRRMVQVFEKHSSKVRMLLERAADSGASLDIQDIMYKYTFDSICEIAFGHPVDSLGGVETDVAFQRAFDAIQTRSTQRIMELTWRLQRALRIGAAERDMRVNVQLVTTYINKILDERERTAVAEATMGDDESSDLITMFERECADAGRKPTRKEYQDLVMSFMIAGRDTTACALTWAFWELSNAPDIRARVEEDIRQSADPAEMEFTQAVFQEVVRLHPSVPIDFKECVEDDVLPDGTRVFKGMQIGFNPCVITRNPNVYEQPNSFTPDRWMTSDARCRKYDEYTYPCFNAGPRICLGRHMAALEVKMLLAEVMSTLRVDVVRGFEPKLRLHVILMTQNGMQVNVTRRADTH